MPIEMKLFLCGVFGSALVEILAIVRYYQGPGKLPMRYSKCGFWLVRTLLAGGGGIFAILYEPASSLLAVHIGVSTPLLVATITQALPEERGEVA